ncbi:hypothetical protein PLICRDRAFT_340979 [Plicaturopsis crispa FD-325 SS-3]|uniref:Uncharacterized protein n=1 Tax=Plicaturopsis crispa FD-325 SS-3 TaxID=944288 RepID=A0A0C9T629_PLICR|nr:hypothetical protein PLICRDRAFT_340979 [Plicaturopsis crispa FD-325 SS-3]
MLAVVGLLGRMDQSLPRRSCDFPSRCDCAPPRVIAAIVTQPVSRLRLPSSVYVPRLRVSCLGVRGDGSHASSFFRPLPPSSFVLLCSPFLPSFHLSGHRCARVRLHGDVRCHCAQGRQSTLACAYSCHRAGLLAPLDGRRQPYMHMLPPLGPR